MKPTFQAALCSLYRFGKLCRCSVSFIIFPCIYPHLVTSSCYVHLNLIKSVTPELLVSKPNPTGFFTIHGLTTTSPSCVTRSLSLYQRYLKLIHGVIDIKTFHKEPSPAFSSLVDLACIFSFRHPFLCLSSVLGKRLIDIRERPSIW
jgi:hypothetical protein